METRLKELDEERSEALKILRERETFNKYKRLSKKLADTKAEVSGLERQKSAFEKIHNLQRESRILKLKSEKLREKLESHISSQPRLYQTIRSKFSVFIREVLRHSAVLSTKINNEGNPEYRAEILDPVGNTTSQDLGTTFRKILCVAFDIAVLTARLDTRYIRFAYHDGVFEGLDDLVKDRLLAEFWKSSSAGIQHIITLIDADLPPTQIENRFDGSVVCNLHDKGKEGRLFRMPEW